MFRYLVYTYFIPNAFVVITHSLSVACYSRESRVFSKKFRSVPTFPSIIHNYNILTLLEFNSPREIFFYKVLLSTTTETRNGWEAY